MQCLTFTISLCFVTVSVLCLFLTEPWVGMQCVSVVYPCHTHFLCMVNIWVCVWCLELPQRLNIGLRFLCRSRKNASLCGPFCPDSPANSPANVWRQWDFSLILLFLIKFRILVKQNYQGRLSFRFFERRMADLVPHRQNKSKQSPATGNMHFYNANGL